MLTTKNIQLEKSSTSTQYEPYKTNILTVNEPVELRGIGKVKDELNLLTGELTQRIGEVVFDGSEDENWHIDMSSNNVTRLNMTFKVGLDNIPYKDVKIPPYILGIWLGDGNSKNFALTCSDNDLEPLIEFRKFALSQGAKERVERRPKAQCATYHFSYGKVMELLNYYNLRVRPYV